MKILRLFEFVAALCFFCVESIPAPAHSCECALFLKDDLWLPSYLVMSLTNEFHVDCTYFGNATESCKNYCSDEMVALNILYNKDPSILKDYPPSQNLPCFAYPTATVSFSKACGSQTYVLSSRVIGPPVCCDAQTHRRTWCDKAEALEEVEGNSVFEGRKLDLQKHQDDESQNEIDSDSGTSSSVATYDKSKPEKNKLIGPLVPPGTSSWVQTFMKFFGYKSIGDFVKNIDIFSIPSKVQSAIRTYKDEVSMGRCYMEFTTFKVFTKQENPFKDLLRRRRDVQMDPITRFDAYVEDDDYVIEVSQDDDLRSISSDSKKSAQNDSVKKIVKGIVDILERSDSTKQYANLVSTFLPVITQLASGGFGGASSGQSSPLSMILKFAGPILSQIGSAQSPSNNIGVESYPTQSPTTTAGSVASSPLTSMALNMLGNVISNFFSSPGVQNKIGTRHPTTTTPTKPTTTASAPPSFDFASSGLSTLLKLFLQSSASSPVARPIETPKPVTTPASQNIPDIEDKGGKTFIDMLLELLRPVFISIIGTAPGDNGVKDIRRVSTLSTLGRVDDSLREEVDSPFFCLKKYMVNKAWSVTENGVRNIVSKFTPEEQARMMERMFV